MEHIIQILMKRDDLTRKEAENVIKNALDMIYNSFDDPGHCEEIWTEETGLELDYLLEVLI